MIGSFRVIGFPTAPRKALGAMGSAASWWTALFSTPRGGAKLKPRTVLLNAGPWVAVPPGGYGGIECLIADLVPALRRRGVRVVLATVEESAVQADEKIWVYEKGQYRRLLEPYTLSSGVAHAHMLRVLERLEGGDIDLVHDHLEVVGPSLLSALRERCPPVLHTLHWDLHKHAAFYASFKGRGRVFFNGVSDSQITRAAANLRDQTVGAVPVAIDPGAFRYQTVKEDYFLVLGRVTEVKGQDIAARICRRRGCDLVIAGPVGGVSGPEQLQAELRRQHSQVPSLPDVRYYLDRVQPHLDGRSVRWVGSVTGSAKLDLLGRARALLMPIRWDEPGGIVVIEAMACGTPVIALNRGNLSSIIDHGVNGFLADDEEELAEYLERAGEIAPAACRHTVEKRFSTETMAAAYLDLYEQVINRAGAPTAAIQ